MNIKLFEEFEFDDYQEIDYNTFKKMCNVYYPDCFLNKYEINRITKILKDNNIEIISIQKEIISDEIKGIKAVSTGFLTNKGRIFKVEDDWYLFRTDRLNRLPIQRSNNIFKCDQIEGLEKLLKDLNNQTD
jgi:hypothetical protein